MPDRDDEARQALLRQEAETFDRCLALARTGAKVDIDELLKPLPQESHPRMRRAFEISLQFLRLQTAQDEPRIVDAGT